MENKCCHECSSGVNGLHKPCMGCDCHSGYCKKLIDQAVLQEKARVVEDCKKWVLAQQTDMMLTAGYISKADIINFLKSI